MEILPRLRADIQLLPAEMGGQRVLAVKDMLGLSAEVVMLRPEAAAILPLFDGEHTVLDLQQAMMRARGNQLVMRSEAEQVVRELDRLLVLQSDSYVRRKQEVRREFAALPQRPPAMAGSAYPEEPEEARAFMQGILAMDGMQEPFPPVRALVAPHIDLRVGKQVYAQAYGRLTDHDYRRIVVLGTGHGLDDGLFSLSAKRYETPLGGFPPDTEAIERLSRAGIRCLAPDDFAHRREHSIEFQVLFLRAIMKGDIPLVPILVGSLGSQLTVLHRAAAIPEAAEFLKALVEICGPGTLVVAGVDLSHVGPKFGHPDPAGVHQEEFQEHDRQLLAALCRGSAEELWAEGRRVEDRFNVCGLSTLAVLLEILPGVTGQVLGYEIWHEAPTRSAVSFAAAVIA